MRICRWLVVVAVLQSAALALAVGPRERSGASGRSSSSRESNARQPSRPTSRPSINPGNSPTLSSRISNADRAEALRRRQPQARPSMLPGNVNVIDRNDRYAGDRRTSGRVNISRPNVNVNRPNIGNNYGIDNSINTSVVNNRIINNNTTVINNNYGNQRINSNNNNNRRRRSYYDDLHYGWRPTGWNSYRPAYGNFYSVQSSTSVVSLGGVQVGYVNPFFVRPSTVVVGLDYSQPIHVPAPDYRETNDDLIRSEQAIRRFDDARELFVRGEYGRANDLVDEAIRLLPSDPTLHQFRALVLFARGRYQDAAATIYSVLAVDSGWTRDTLAKLYDDPARYEEQFRELQRFVAANPEATDARFLLAYHYLMLGELERAAKNLEVIRIARPDDRVTLNMLAAIRS